MCAELAHEHALEDLHKITDHTSEENPARGMLEPLQIAPSRSRGQTTIWLLYYILYGKDADFRAKRSCLLGELS